MGDVEGFVSKNYIVERIEKNVATREEIYSQHVQRVSDCQKALDDANDAMHAERKKLHDWQILFNLVKEY